MTKNRLGLFTTEIVIVVIFILTILPNREHHINFDNLEVYLKQTHSNHGELNIRSKCEKKRLQIQIYKSEMSELKLLIPEDKNDSIWILSNWGNTNIIFTSGWNISIINHEAYIRKQQLLTSYTEILVDGYCKELEISKK